MTRAASRLQTERGYRSAAALRITTQSQKGLTEVNASAEARDVQKFEIHGYILRPKRNPAE